MRVFIVKATTEEATVYVEEILRSMRKEDGVEVEIPRRRKNKPQIVETFEALRDAKAQGTLPTETP